MLGGRVCVYVFVCVLINSLNAYDEPATQN